MRPAELVDGLANVPGKRGIFTRMVDAALERPDDTVREAVYPVVPGGVKTLSALARELKATERCPGPSGQMNWCYFMPLPASGYSTAWSSAGPRARCLVCGAAGPRGRGCARGLFCGVMPAPEDEQDADQRGEVVLRGLAAYDADRLAHVGTFPCLRRGRGAAFAWSIRSAWASRYRVSRGSMTSSTRPRSAA